MRHYHLRQTAATIVLTKRFSPSTSTPPIPRTHPRGYTTTPFYRTDIPLRGTAPDERACLEIVGGFVIPCEEG